jgi:aryl-alcohol dehydrogenase-like predicted oxidoreductase
MTSSNSLRPLSKLGLGAWAIGGPYEFGWGPVDDDESIETIRAACERGIDWVDTAPAYGCGHSEEVVGRAIKSLHHPCKVFTKCGRVWDTQGKVTSDLRPQSIREQWHQSCSRLGVDVIDLYQVHRPDTTTGTPLAESWTELLRMREEGKVRALGLCNVTCDQYEECENIGHVDTIQTPVNLVRSGDAELRTSAEQNGTSVLAYSPMESGLLTGRFDAARIEALPPDDWRKRSSKFSGESLAKANLVVRELKLLSNQTGFSVPALAVAWVLRQPGVTSAIVGARHPTQLSDWQDAARINLSHAEWSNIDQLTTRS